MIDNLITSFLVTLSQSRTTNSSLVEERSPSLFGKSKTNDSLKTGLRLLFLMCVFFFAILWPSCIRYILTYGSECQVWVKLSKTVYFTWEPCQVHPGKIPRLQHHHGHPPGAWLVAEREKDLPQGLAVQLGTNNFVVNRGNALWKPEFKLWVGISFFVSGVKHYLFGFVHRTAAKSELNSLQLGKVSKTPRGGGA